MSQDHLHNEEELLHRIAKGDQDATKTLFNRYYPRLYYFALRLTQNESEAQDQAQEAFLAFWQRKENFRNASAKEAEAFMITVVRNKAYNYNKHRKIKTGKQTEIAEGLELSNDFIEAQVIQEDIFNRIYQEILSLSPSHLEVLKLVFIEELIGF